MLEEFASSAEEIDRARHFGQLASNLHRITSYNVCYTKLLRACANVEDQIQGIKQGADAYIQKPFNMEHLVARIEGMLRSRKHRITSYNVCYTKLLRITSGWNGLKQFNPHSIKSGKSSSTSPHE